MKIKRKSANIAKNKKANFSYEIKEKIEAGLVLKGWQVKSLRAGQVSLANNPYITINAKGEAFISGMIINPLLQAHTIDNSNPNESVKLLLHKKEIDRLIGQVEKKGMTIVLIDLYWKRDKVKATIGLGRGKNTIDKRQTIKDREQQREQQRIQKYKN